MIDKLIIRPYLEEDKDGVVDLWEAVFPDSPPWNVPEEDIERKLKIQRELFLVAELDKVIIGTAMAGFDGHRGWVYSVAVDEKFRKRGIGKELMERVENGLRAIGCTKLNLQVRSSNTEVVDFYRKLGYLVEDRVSMGKRLVQDDKSGS